MASIDDRALPRGKAEHATQITRLREMPVTPHPFRAINSWFENQEVKEIIEEAWMTFLEPNQFYKLIKKVKVIKLNLKNWEIANGDPRRLM